MFYPSGFFRRKALTALKGRWQPALLVSLIVSLPTLLMQSFSIFTGNDVVTRLQAVIITASRDGVMSQDVLFNEINALVRSTGFWTVRGLELLALLVTPCLTLGMFKWLTDLLRGQEQPVSAVFSRMRWFFKAIGLKLLVVLKILLWMLPGIAASVITYLPVFRAGTVAEQRALLLTSQGYSFPILLLTAVPGILAALRYALADFILAEKPETKISACIRRSRELMNGQKKTLFFLVVSFLLWYLLEILLSSMLPGVIGLLFQMLAGLALDLWLACSVCVFFLRLEKAAEDHRDPDAEPEAESLN